MMKGHLAAPSNGTGRRRCCRKNDCLQGGEHPSNEDIRNDSNAAGPTDVVFGYGPGSLGWLALAGDYDGR